MNPRLASVFSSRPFLVLDGTVILNGEQAGEGDSAIFARTGDGIALEAKADAKLLVTDGEPIDETVVGHGPFVMNSRAEIEQAFEDYQLGHMGELAMDCTLIPTFLILIVLAVSWRWEWVGAVLFTALAFLNLGTGPLTR